MLKLTFELYPEDGHIKPYEHPYGYVFRAVIMKWLHEIKPELVHVFHEREEIRPYAINYIIHNKMPKLDFILTTYHDDLSDAILNDIISNEKGYLTLGQKRYFISKIQFERINPIDFMESAQPVINLRIHFFRPVSFNTSMGDYPVRFPIPLIFFGNLANIWNDIMKGTSEVARETLLNWVNAHVYVSSYNMRTVRVNIGKPKPVIGGIGSVSFKVSKINRLYYKHFLEDEDRSYDYEYINADYKSNCCWLDILSRFGEYTNVGVNRTAGMGVIHYYNRNYLSKKDLLK